MATELVQVLIQMVHQIEQLTGDPSVDNATSIASGNEELKGSRDDQWMLLFLQAAKLMETLYTLPSGFVAQFQTCNWAFISSLVSDSKVDPFVPFSTRIHELLCDKYGRLTSHEQRMRSASLQHVKTIQSFNELRPFFHALASQHHAVLAGYTGTNMQECHLRDATILNGSMTMKAAVARLEHSLLVDFAEHEQL
uniref:RUN domain-containing protein n=1 Tax=Panagrellus redivivus TaxID=6233 RepID=A0A7E4UQU5_PANRE